MIALYYIGSTKLEYNRDPSRYTASSMVCAPRRYCKELLPFYVTSLTMSDRRCAVRQSTRDRASWLLGERSVPRHAVSWMRQQVFSNETRDQISCLHVGSIRVASITLQVLQSSHKFTTSDAASFGILQ